MVLLLCAAFWASAPEPVVYPHRWVFVSRSLRRDEHVEEIEGILRTAAAHALNGVVLSAGLGRLSTQPPDYFPRLETIAGKVLWGTDWPGPGVRSPRQNVEEFCALPLSEAAKRRILSENAESFFDTGGTS